MTQSFRQATPYTALCLDLDPPMTPTKEFWGTAILLTRNDVFKRWRAGASMPAPREPYTDIHRTHTAPGLFLHTPQPILQLQ
jgi:hypothetical protein